MPKRSASSRTQPGALAAQADDAPALSIDEVSIDDGSDSEASDIEQGPIGLSGLDAIIAASRRQHSDSGASLDSVSPTHSAVAPTHATATTSASDDDAGVQPAQPQLSRHVPAGSLLRDEALLADPGSDSSEDERPNRNTVGNVPLVWYKDEEHIGYDRDGQPIAKSKAGVDMLDAVLRRNDTPGLALRTVYDPYNGEELTLSKEELRTLLNIQRGKLPDVQIDAHADLVDWYSNEPDAAPASGAPEPKRRFAPSKWEEKKIVKLVRALRRGWIKPREEREREERAESPPPYLLWDDGGAAADTPRTQAGLPYIPAPKPDPPGHEESYNPPAEYLPNEEEARAIVEAAEAQERHPWLPKRFDCLRHVPQYERAVHERFERCLDLYLCPRVKSKRIPYKAEDLVPKALPAPRDLRPYPSRLLTTYEGHCSKVRCVSCDPSGHWLLTGSDDGTVRLWEALTGFCARVWDLGAKVHRVAWCPDARVRLISAVCENKAVLLPSGVGGAAVAEAAREALSIRSAGGAPAAGDEESAPAAGAARWAARDDGGVEIVQRHQLRDIAWHARGDYFATVAPDGATQSVVVHQLSKQSSQNPFRKNRGRVTCTTFHPTKPLFLVATQNNVRVYNLAKQSLVKKLLAGGGVITSISVHSSGDHVLLGTEDNRCLWFDLDLSTKPYKVMRYHEAAVRRVAFHRAYPLFASGSDDASVQIFHGMVYQDLMMNPLVVPVKMLSAHTVHNHSGVLDICFHPSQPWMFTAGGDGKVCLFVDV